MMWLEILLVFFFEASLAVTHGSDDDNTYHNYKIHDDGRVDLLQDLERPARLSDGLAGDGNASFTPENIEVVKGAIQRLIGNLELPDHEGPTGPTRSPPPQRATLTLNTTGITKLLMQLVETTSDAAATTVSMKATRSSYTKLLGELMEYADMMQRTKKPPVRTSKGQVQSPTRYTPPGAAQAEAEAALRQGGRGGRRPTTPATRRTPATRNPLCTHDDDVCATMCFDEENYRITCPPTTRVVTLPRVALSRLLAMLSNLVADFDTNITEQFRQRLVKEGYETCEPAPTTEPSTTVSASTDPPAIYDYEESNKTGAIISKCFVCGLDDKAIPMNAHCSDAFAGEFLPMNPVDASARGHLASYRKYCKFMDMVPWFVNGTDSRSIWGRWTGGCSVRWVDLSGVYTQRTCRNRFRPVRGSHFVSKRMARLEMALRHVDNGCIISPMASLVPFSRGVSLYARFHACVCTGNWCNRSERLGRSHWLLVLQTLLLTPFS